jgi:CHAT domain-containing protein
MHAALSHTPLPESTTSNLLQLEAVAPTSDLIASDTRQSLLMIQRFFMAVAANEPGADEYVIKAASSELSRMKLAVAQAPFNVTPINLYTRVAFGIAAISLAGRSSRTASQSEMLFELAANLNRSQKNIESQYLYLLAQADTSVEMAAFQALYRTEQSLDRLERETFAQRVSSFRGGLTTAPTSNLDSRIWGELQQLILLRGKYSKSQVRAGEILGRSTNLLAATFGSLRPDERFVTNLAFAGKFARICVDRHSLSASVATFDAPIEQARLSRIHRALTAPIGLSDEDQFPVEDAKQLSLLLLGADDQCLGSAQQVVFAPLLDFTSVPMATLIDPVPSGTASMVHPGSAQINWLGANRGITMVSDPQQFLAARRLRRSSTYPLPFLGIGDPRFGGKTADGVSRAEVALRGSSNGALRLADLGEANQLPDTATELKQVAARFGANSEILLGEKSREMDFREKLLENYRVISFATHGLLREEIEGLPEPALLLTPFDSRAVENDGLLTTTEISNLDIPADLVILSACNSANFDLRSFAPEVASLSTAFFLAGAHSTLASLWSVDSAATKRLMVLFADEYVAKAAPGAAIALRNAIRRFLKSGSSPHFQDPRFWAAFSVYGDGGPLDDAPEGRVMPGRLVQTDLASDYGEALALTHNRAGTVVAGYVADGGSRVVGSLQQLDEAGQVVWRLKDREHSFVLQRGDTVGATSALAWSASTNQPSELIFESFDTTGTLVTHQTIPSESNEVPLSLQVISENEFVVGTKIPGRGGHDDYLIRTLDSKGSTQSLRKFEVGPLYSDPAAMTIVNTGNAIWVGILEADPMRKPISRVNEFGVRESCIAPTVTSLHHLDHNLEDIEAPLHILNAVVKDAVALPDDRVAFALMMYDGCTTVDVSSAVRMEGRDALRPHSD